jgi:glutamate-1-semialdehyde aminotransferase
VLLRFADMVKSRVNGSEATNPAIRMVRGFTSRDRIAVCKDRAMFGAASSFICTTPMFAGILLAHNEVTRSCRYKI